MSIFFENAWAQDGGVGGDPIMCGYASNGLIYGPDMD